LLPENKLFRVLVILTGLHCLASLSFGQEKTATSEKRPVTVADTIRMTRIAGSGYPSWRRKSGFEVFSPDGKQFAIVVARGDVEKNTGEYSLLVFKTADGPAVAGQGRLCLCRLHRIVRGLLALNGLKTMTPFSFSARAPMSRHSFTLFAVAPDN